MGAGIAQVCLQAGHDVQLFDVDHEAIERGRGRIADGLQRLVDKGKLPIDGRDRMLQALRDAHSLEGLAEESDIVIEAALEDLALKETVFRALGSADPIPDVLATNTSALSITRHRRRERPRGPRHRPAFLQPGAGHAARRGGRGRSNLARDGRPGRRASRRTSASSPWCARDSPGFIVNRVNRPFTLEALRMLEAHEAGVEQIDRAVRSAGYPMGPFELMDLVGIDVNLAVATALWEGFDEALRFTPSPIQRDLVEAGHLGRKSGRRLLPLRGRPTHRGCLGIDRRSLRDDGDRRAHRASDHQRGVHGRRRRRRRGRRR